MISIDGKCTFSKTSNGTFRIRFFDETGARQSANIRTVAERDLFIRTVKRRESLEQWFPRDHQASNVLVKNFSHLAEKFLEHRKDVREISDSCFWTYESQLNNHILPILGKVPIAELHLKDVERLAAFLKKTKKKTFSYLAVRKELHEHDEFLSASYRREILTLACSIAKFGYLRDYLPSHPFKAFDLPDAGDKPYDYWRLEEEDAFLNWLEAGGLYYKPHGNIHGEKIMRRWNVWNCKKVYDVVLFALRTGMRKGEISSLKMRDVDFDSNLITVHTSWSFKEGVDNDTTKNGSYRRIEMNEDVRQILHQYRHEGPEHRPFELIMRSHTMKNFSKLTKKAGVRELHFHALRHTFLTNIANGFGMDTPVELLKVMELAGHKDIETTMVYVHGAGIKNTSSRQWSRAERRMRAQNVMATTKKEVQVSAYTPQNFGLPFSIFEAGKEDCYLLKTGTLSEFGPIFWPDLGSVLGNIA
ncbi:MAG TPA: tyrosine-type recombinase/integrase [Oligoflexus sp.]|uniref:tyrosine-type recombinase/integrase n=1 Tax=Oligoflexus sp. TaxID=1971216 RepID=UPI002D45CF85|nr:tyrosine-type recombinase/integrase [Oligoflexus sp.]HYX35330.1 tyrosine-type recombinase/integrase [Oligoflexus sp.]